MRKYASSGLSSCCDHDSLVVIVKKPQHSKCIWLSILLNKDNSEVTDCESGTNQKCPGKKGEETSDNDGPERPAFMPCKEISRIVESKHF